MKRPLKSRFWFYRPGSWLPGFRFIQRGGDEFDWHTLVFGSWLTGAVVFATRPCGYSGDCADLLEDPNLYEWPVDRYGHNHLDSMCQCPTCLDHLDYWEEDPVE